jgi:hypothetical protein
MTLPRRHRRGHPVCPVEPTSIGLGVSPGRLFAWVCHITGVCLMVRKFAAALVALVLAVGAVFAEEVRGTFVSFADGKLTLKVDDKEKEYTIPADLKVKRKGKDGEVKESLASEALSRTKEGRPITLTVDGSKVTEVKMGRGKKGK